MQGSGGFFKAQQRRRCGTQVLSAAFRRVWIPPSQELRCDTYLGFTSSGTRAPHAFQPRKPQHTSSLPPTISSTGPSPSSTPARTSPPVPVLSYCRHSSPILRQHGLSVAPRRHPLYLQRHTRTMAPPTTENLRHACAYPRQIPRLSPTQPTCPAAVQLKEMTPPSWPISMRCCFPRWSYTRTSLSMHPVTSPPWGHSGTIPGGRAARDTTQWLWSARVSVLCVVWC